MIEMECHRPMAAELAIPPFIEGNPTLFFCLLLFFFLISHKTGATIPPPPGWADDVMTACISNPCLSRD